MRLVAPVSKSLQKAYGRKLTAAASPILREISGHGITATVDGHAVAAGNSKLMAKLGVEYHDCHCVGTIIHMAVDGKYAGHIVISDVVKPHSREGHRAAEKGWRGKRPSCSRATRSAWPKACGGAWRGRSPQRAAPGG